MLQVPLVRQAYTWTCGPACLAACLYYWGAWDGSEPDLYALCGTTAADGTTPQAIAEAARAYKLSARVRTGLTVESLRRYLANGATVILGFQAWADHPAPVYRDCWTDGHYAVLCDIDRGNVVVMDPSLPARYGRLTLQDFLDRWHDVESDGIAYDHGAIVIRGKAPRALDPAQVR